MEKAMASREESEERVKRKRRKKDLEEIRRNALAFKRNLRNRAELQKKSSLMKTLNQFASQRQGIEDVVNSQDSLLNRTKAASEPEPKSLNMKGFFQAGIKGKLITRTRRPQDKLKEAILNSDALQILQSGGLSKMNSSDLKALASDSTNLEFKAKLSQILGNSPESDTDENESNTNSIKTSPVLGGAKGFAKRRNVIKSDAENIANNKVLQKKATVAMKNVSKEERCKRRLFEDEKTSVNSNKTAENVYNQCTYIDSPVRFSPRKSTPENVIYFTERVPQTDVNKKVQDVKKLNPKDPKLIKYYVQTCKMISEKELKSIFSLVHNDPLEKAKTFLRITYANTIKEYLRKQTSRHSTSSNSEIILEPDSAIARTLKKNAELKTKFIAWNSENSPYSSRNDEIDDLESEFSAVFSDKLEKSTKTKHVSSNKSERSNRAIPTSVRAVADPESVNIKMKMDSIDPNRHELIARYLKDIDTSSHQYYKSRSIFNEQRNLSKETDSSYYKKEKLFISDNNKKTIMFQKSAKHVPAILRKNRTVDNNTEKYQNIKETITKAPMQDLNGESSLISERTPNCTNTIPNQVIEAPKCKYVYMNAKYNQPPRINAAQNRMYQRSSVSEQRLCMSPKNTESDFILFQNYELSPIKEQTDLFTNTHNHQKYLLCQDNSEQDTNCMMRMPSFGEIQEKTDRLTLHSSQSQHCSQESMNNMHSSQELCPSNSNYCQQCEFSNKALYSNQSCLRCKEFYALKPDFQIVQPESHSLHRGKDLNHPLNNHQPLRNQSLQQQEVPMNYKFVQQQSVRQPMKYVAMEGNRMPQRHPVYNMNDNHSHARKISMPNQQSSMLMKHCHSMHMQNQVPRCTISSLHYSNQEDSQPICSSNFDYENLIVPNQSGPSNYNSDIVGLNGRTIAYVPSSIAEQSFVPKQSIPMHTAVNNPIYMGHHMIPSTSSYSQVEYQHNHCNNQDFKVNDVYLQEMNRNIHLKRSSDSIYK